MSSQGVRPPPSNDTLRDVIELYYGDELEPGAVVDLAELDNIIVQMGLAQDGSIRHDPVACDPVGSPFPSAAIEAAFMQCLHQLLQYNIVPPGYGLLPEELGPNGYPSIQVLNIGRRGGRIEEHELPAETWYGRAVEWARALEAMTQTFEMYGVNP